MQLRNWSGNVVFSTGTLLRPTTVEQVQELVAGTTHVRALGTGHSFSPIADTDGALLSVADLLGEVEIDGDAVSFPAGLRYGEVAGVLEEHGRALHNLGSLPHISVAGACATGTHGSGVGNGTLATAVRAIEFVDGRGELVRLARGDADFDGAVVALGALGITTRLTLATEPNYQVRQDVWLDLPFASLLEHLDEVLGAGYSVSAFTDWRRPDVVERTWVKSRVDTGEPAGLGAFGARLASEAQHPVAGQDVQAATEQLGRPGPWNERLPHFRLDFTPSVGAELQSEWFVDRADGAAALEAVRELAGRIGDVLLVSEIRTIAADELWLSPFFGRDTLALHFTWQLEPEPVRAAVDQIEAALAPFAARPHWGKVFGAPPAHPNLPRFRELIERYDPQHRFGNAYLEQFVY